MKKKRGVVRIEAARRKRDDVDDDDDERALAPQVSEKKMKIEQEIKTHK
jgi:hypothetical protein